MAPYASGATRLPWESPLAKQARLAESVMVALSPWPDLEVSVDVVDGLAARVLLDCAANAELLVLGSGSGAPGELGPVAQACLRRAPCPVVVVSAAHDRAPALDPVPA